MDATQAKFWMVYGMSQRAPTRQHWTKDEAEAEASRLAKQNPGITFVVLSAVGAFRTDIPPVVPVQIVKRRPVDSDIPF